MSDKPIIDISKFNTVKSWSAVANNVSGVIMRLGYSGYGNGACVIDPKFSQHLAGVQAVNIPYGVYYFPASVNEIEATKEAAFILNSINSYGLNLSFPIFLDSEIAETKNKSGRADKLDRNTRTRLLMRICEILHDAGYHVGVYASKSWFNSNLDGNQIYTYVYKWVAQYNTNCTYQGIYHLWQYTSNGIITGIEGRVDCSKLIRDLPKGMIAETVTHEPEPTPAPAPEPEPIKEARRAETMNIDVFDQYGERMTGWTLKYNCY